MAFTGQTPESLLQRSDSKDPATTCKGITKLGRPCRNPLRLDAAQTERYHGVLAVTSVVSDDSGDEEIGAAAFFCHKHKDQAEKLVAANASATTPHKQDTQIYPLQNRSSIDTLVARLGVLEVNDPADGERRKRREKRPGDRRSDRPPRRVNRPPTWDQVQGPLMEVPSDLMKPRPARERPTKKKQGFWASLCCGGADDDYVEMVRHKKRVTQNQEKPPMSQYPQEPSVQPARPSRNSQRPTSSARPTSSLPPRKPLNEKPPRPSNAISPQPTSETANLMSYIPKTCSPQTAAALLAELIKPISSTDEEGYIYIFWLTPESAGPAPSSMASTLLAPPSRPDQNRRTSDILRQYSVRKPQRPNSATRPRRSSAVTADDTTAGAEEKNTILLKIGRANNVHRRMNEWTNQCGYDISLVRFYPYVSSTPSPSPHPSPRNSPAQSRRQSAQNVTSSSRRPSEAVHQGSSSGVRKSPYIKRVERLIQLELAEQNVKKQCEACGKEHREWFEVEASRDGVRKVDEVIKRWVSWAEMAAGVSR